MRRLLAALAIATTLLVPGASDAYAVVVADAAVGESARVAASTTDDAAPVDDDAVDSGRWVRAGLIGLVVGVVIGVVVARRNRARRFGASRVP